MLLSCAWTLAVAGAVASWAADLGPAGRPVLLAQARVPVLAQTQPPRQQPRLISLDFKDADINNILRILAEFSGLNIVSSDDVKGKVTVRLQNVPWQQALDSVVRAAKLGYVQEGNIIRVDKLENLTREAEAQFKAEQREVEIQQRRKEADIRLAEQDRAKKLAEQDFEFRSAPLAEEVIPLKYAHVGSRRVESIDFLSGQVRSEERKGVEEAITGGVKKEEGKPAGLLSSRGQLTIDPRTNSIIVRDVPSNITKIKEFIGRLDRPTPAIQIEARIVDISKDDARRLGVVWGGAFTPRAGPNSPNIDIRGAGPRQGSLGTPPSTVADFPAPGALRFPSGNLFGLALGWVASNFALDLSLQAMEGEGRARVISSPSLLTLNNEAATIAVGQRLPIISGTADTITVLFTDVTTRLQVLPRVVPEDQRLVLSIAVKRETLIDIIRAGNAAAPQVSTKQAVTQVRIPDGGTVVLGGLREDDVRSRGEGAPWIKNIPVLGWLFKNELAEASRTELMVFLTAKVMDNPGQAAVTPEEVPASPGAPAPGRTGQAPAPAEPVVPVAAVSSVTPAAESRAERGVESEVGR